MQRWFRSLAALRLPSQPPLTPLRRRVFHSSSSMTKSPLISPSILRPTPLLLLFNTPSPLRVTSNQPSSPPLSLMQVRHLTLKQRKRKLKSRQPPSPVVSKLNKIKIKSYSSFKGRFRTMKDGQIRRRKEGKRHNAHHKSKIAKRRGRLPAIVPAAYAKVMKKLNFCG